MEDKLAISLSPAQRDLLLKYESSFNDNELFRSISITVKKGKNYEIYLEEEHIQSLLNQLAQLSYNEKDEEFEHQLDKLGDYLVNLMEDLEEDDYSEYSNNTGAVCVVKVALAYAKKIWRKIAVREGQTLNDLHNTIFDAFDRDDEHMYSFFFPHSRQKFNPRKIYQSSDEYTHPYACEEQGILGSDAQDASKTTIGSLDLDEKQVFYYLFDFGDEWWHEITVESTDEPADDEKYSRVIERKGESPEQY
jgi:predicted nucleotidyltransferase component of viral defense system